VDSALRKNIAEMRLPEALALLRDADREAPDQIDVQNPVRVRRALEIVLSTGKPLAAARTTWKSAGSSFRGIILERDRADLLARIAANVDAMFEQGVVEEVGRAGQAGPGAARAIGFREIQDLIAARITRHECRNRIIVSTRRYAKRQLTWCRHQFSFPAINLTTEISPNELIETALRLMDGSDA
jgi:tRNA dimethylallyltransferase